MLKYFRQNQTSFRARNQDLRPNRSKANKRYRKECGYESGAAPPGDSDWGVKRGSLIPGDGAGSEMTWVAM